MEMEVDGAPVHDMGDNILMAVSNPGTILRAIWFPFAALWWITTNIFTLPYTIVSWTTFLSGWAFSLPFMIVSRLVQFSLAPFRFLFSWVWIPWPWTWSLSGVIDTIGPVLTCILIAGTVGILTGISTYFIALSLSAITESILGAPHNPTAAPNSKNPTKSRNRNNGKNTPQYDSDNESQSQATPYFNKNELSNLSLSRRSSFTDFDTDDASALVQQHRTRPGPDLYAAWRERVDSAKLGPGLGPKINTSVGSGVLRSPPSGIVISPSGSKRRLPGLLFGTTIHEEDDDSL